MTETYKCMYCGKATEAKELRTIDGIFEYNAEEVSFVVGRKVEGSLGTGKITVCNEPCADTIRNELVVITTDLSFEEL